MNKNLFIARTLCVVIFVGLLVSGKYDAMTYAESSKEAPSFLGSIGTTKAQKVIKSNPNLTIAIVDTGIDLKHPVLKNSIVKGYNIIDPAQSPQDDNGHGTNVAGVISAVVSKRLYTPKGYWAPKIMPIKALDASGYGDEEQLIEGLRYAIDHGAKLIVLSVGLYRYSKELSEMMDYAENHNVLLIAATGNEGAQWGTKTEIKYPAAYPTVLAVGGATLDGKAMKQSNGGPEVDLVAPWHVYTTALGGGYMNQEGTSMAAPQVAAAAALVWATNPKLQPFEIRNILRQKARDLGPKGWDSVTGYGMLQVDQAMKTPYVTDMYENNNRLAYAKRLTIGKTQSADWSNSRDQDWLYMDTPYKGTLYVHIRTTGDPNAVQLSYYANAASKPQAISFHNGLAKVNTPKGRGYLQLMYKKSTSSTKVGYLLTSSLQIRPDAYEDNGRQYKAYSLPPKSQTIRGNFHQHKDQDWFVLPIAQAGKVRLKLDTTTVRMDPALSYGTLNNMDSLDLASEGEHEITSFMDITPGKFYILVSNANENPYSINGEYILIIQYLTEYKDIFEPNDRPFQSREIALNTAYQGVFGKTGDADWFLVSADQDGALNIDLQSISATNPVQLTLYNQGQNQVGQISSSPGAKQLHYKKKISKGNYYIRLQSAKANTKEMYQLRVVIKDT